MFKIQADRHGDLHYVRVYSGELKANSRVYNPGKDKKENVPQLWRIQADRRSQVDSAAAGDIVGIIGLRHSVTGDTLCDAQDPILLESITFPETVISMAIEPETSAERKKLADVLEMMKRQDPTFRARENEETGQTLISGMGELHLEVIKHRLLRDFKLNVRVHKPRVSYRETIAAGGRSHRRVPPQRRRADALRQASASAWSRSARRASRSPSVARPAPVAARAVSWPPSVEVLTRAGRRRRLAGLPADAREDHRPRRRGRTRPTPTRLAFRYAAADAFEKALREAGIVLLEPIMRLEVTVPEEHLGDIVGDLQQRRAIITRTHTRGRNTVIEAHAPLANLFGYSSAMRGLSQGRATCTMEPQHYGPAPPEVLESFM